MKIYQVVQTLLVGDTQTDRQTGVLISLLSFLESRLITKSLIYVTFRYECRRKQLWSNLMYYYSPEGKRKHTETSVRIASHWAEVGITDLLKRKQECQPLSYHVWNK
jgi:hypothetical protein